MPLQHYPVFTIGKRGAESDFRIPVEVGRGEVRADHGSGQPYLVWHISDITWGMQGNIPGTHALHAF